MGAKKKQVAVAKPAPPKAPAEKAPGPRKAPAQKIAGWTLSRQENGQWARCYWHERGLRQKMWTMQPTQALIAERWGSGEYKVTFVRVGGGAGGSQSLTIDDPSLPSKPVYPNPPSVEAPAPAAPPPEPEAAPLDKLMASMMSGQQQSPVLWLTLYRELDGAARRDAMREADMRVARVQADAQLAVERERIAARQQVDNAKALYEALITVQRPAAPERDDDDDDLSDRLDEIEARMTAPAAEGETGVDFLARRAGEALGMLKDHPEIVAGLAQKIGLLPKAS